MGIKKDALNYIAESNQGIDDNIWTSSLPIGDLGRHMDSTGANSQLDYWDNHRKKAFSLIKKARKWDDWELCEEAAIEFGKGLHSKQDYYSHRPYLERGNPWPPFRVHPTWWDYYGQLPQTIIEPIGSQNTHNDDNWWGEYAKENNLIGGIYDKWRNSEIQVREQKKAMYNVQKGTKVAYSQLLEEARKSCICQKYFVK